MTIKLPLREKFADLAHIQWSGWMVYLFGKSVENNDGSMTIPKEYVDRWKRQMSTCYDDLPGNEKTSDQEEADKVLATLIHWFWR